MAAESLFTTRFFLLCGLSFFAFLSAFQLLPVAPFRVLALGGSQVAAGMFLGCLTYASALSAPLTGALADRVGTRRVIEIASVAITAVSIGYAVTSRYEVLLMLALVHGVFWSGFLSSSAAYTTEIIPEHRRAEGLGYWGLSSIFAIAVAPPIGLWVFGRGWGWLCAALVIVNVLMWMMARMLPEVHPHGHSGDRAKGPLIDTRILVASVTLFLAAFGYGAVTSFVALFARERGVQPEGLYFTVFAAAMLLTRPTVGPLADRLGHKRVLVPCLALVAAGYLLLALSSSRMGFALSAVVFGFGFSSVYPAFAAYMLRVTDPTRRGSTFGSMLSAFDTGIGSGSIVAGYVADRAGYPTAFGLAAAVACCAVPYFLLVDRTVLAGLRDERERAVSLADHRASENARTR